MKKGIAVGIIALFIFSAVSPMVIGFDIEITGRVEAVSIVDRNTLYVGGSGSGNYSTIQEAINDSSDGDTIFVYDDSSPYYENIVINSSINLIGEDRNTTIIDASGSGDVVSISANWLNISGFMIINGDYGINGKTSNSIINENIINLHNEYGIFLHHSENNSIINNSIVQNKFGIKIEYSNNNIISGNNVLFNRNGIYITTSSNLNIISENHIEGVDTDSGYGLQITLASNNNTITNNTISYFWDGIRLYASEFIMLSYNNINLCDVGIEVEKIIFSTFHENMITNTTFSGMYFHWLSEYNTISNNNILNNSNYGIYIRDDCKELCIFDNNFNSNLWGLRIDLGPEQCIDSIIYHNNFINNTYNAYDGYDNSWFNNICKEGNYWYDYGGNDTNGDGIGDIPYDIYGGGEKDYYPLMTPWGEQRPIANYTYVKENGGIIFDGSSSFDRDGEIISYDWDFGDGRIGHGKVVLHGYNESGTFEVTLTVTDDDGYQGEYILSIEAVKNQQPDAPLIDGPTEGKAFKSHFYNFTSEDPENADVSYYVDWGDDRIDPWSDFLPSGDTYRIPHGWSRGTYTIKSKSKDIYGAVSDWSEFEVTMPKNKPFNFNNNLLNWLFERFPNAFPILRQLLRF